MLDKYRTITYKNAKKIGLLEMRLNTAVVAFFSGYGQQIVNLLRSLGKKFFEATLCGRE